MSRNEAGGIAATHELHARIKTMQEPSGLMPKTPTSWPEHVQMWIALGQLVLRTER